VNNKELRAHGVAIAEEFVKKQAVARWKVKAGLAARLLLSTVRRPVISPIRA